MYSMRTPSPTKGRHRSIFFMWAGRYVFRQPVAISSSKVFVQRTPVVAVRANWICPIPPFPTRNARNHKQVVFACCVSLLLPLPLPLPLLLLLPLLRPLLLLLPLVLL